MEAEFSPLPHTLAAVAGKGVSTNDPTNPFASSALGQQSALANNALASNPLANSMLPSYGSVYTPHQHPMTDVVAGFVGMFRIRKVENGYIVEAVIDQWGHSKEYFAEDLKAAGERITASCVQKELEGQAKHDSGK